MKLIFAINSCLIFLLIVPAKSHNHHHSHHDHGDHSKSHRSSRIWGSLPASPERWKFMALLKIPQPKQNMVSYCSAVLINNRSLLTAAHCLETYPFTKPIEVLFKGKSFKTIDRTKDHDILHKTQSFRIYEKYWDHVGEDAKKGDPYDIAIIKLETPIVLDPAKGIDRVDLPIAPGGKQYPFDPNTCYLVAYGLEMPDYPDRRLQQVKVPVLPKKLCKKGAGDIERQICYGYFRKSSPGTIPKVTADGDSGGAFLCKTMHFHSGKHRKLPRFVLIALNTASIGGPEHLEYFSIGVRITKYMDWIMQNS